MTPPAALRQEADTLGQSLPALLAQAEQLAGTVVLGEHGRRRPGTGDEFWQYRPAENTDSRRQIDWRRSGRSDMNFVRQTEWQAAQTVLFWVDRAQSMQFRGGPETPLKGDRALVLGLALARLLMRGGERIGVLGAPRPAAAGSAGLARFAETVFRTDPSDYGTPQAPDLVKGAQVVLISDFMGDWQASMDVISRATDRGALGALVQVLDPLEERFPFGGRTIFESVGNTLNHETLKAADLRSRYLDRLEERRTALRDIARRSGWQLLCHRTDQSAQSALLWLYTALERRR